MARGAGSGDKLARGSVRASYLVSENKPISKRKWDDMFEGFDPEAFKNKKFVDPNAKKRESEHG
jgi:hypothetical protein